MVNSDKPLQWKKDTNASVDLYNDWFMNFAPKAFRDSRIEATKFVEKAFKDTDFLRDITPTSLRANPSMLPVLRHSTCPPLAVDRLVGLSGVPKGIITSIEKRQALARNTTPAHLGQIIHIIDRLLDRDVFPWIGNPATPDAGDAHRAATVVADRYCGALTNPIIRNAQEVRQLTYIEAWLTARGYKKLASAHGFTAQTMPPGTFSFRMDVPVDQGTLIVKIPVDAVIKPLSAAVTDFPLLVEAKSAGDFANVNKRRKEEAQKFTMLKNTYGEDVRLVLFLCGYFDGAYLGYSAQEGLDWVWEHRVEDFAMMGL